MKKQNEDVVDIMQGAVEPAKVEETITNEDPSAKVESPKAAEPKKETKSQTRGMVFNCVALRVRKEPSFDCEVVETIDKGTSVTINDKESTNEFYSVTTRSGAAGFCSKQFIKLL